MTQVPFVVLLADCHGMLTESRLRRSDLILMKMCDDRGKKLSRRSEDFRSLYERKCLAYNTVPLKAITQHVQHGILDVNVDMIRHESWPAICDAISADKCLEFVGVRSYFGLDVRQYGQVKQNHDPAIHKATTLSNLAGAIAQMLEANQKIQHLELENIPLKIHHVQQICKGLKCNTSLRHISFAYCNCGDSAVKEICSTLKSCRQVATVNLTACDVKSAGVSSILSLIQQLNSQRHGDAWRESLRYRRPDLDDVNGVKRWTLCVNPGITHTSASEMIALLADDFWTKAIDLQCCDLPADVVKAFLQLLDRNKSLDILDLRGNEGEEIAHEIINRLVFSSTGSTFKWLRPVRDLRKIMHVEKNTWKSMLHRSSSSSVSPSTSWSGRPIFKCRNAAVMGKVCERFERHSLQQEPPPAPPSPTRPRAGQRSWVGVRSPGKCPPGHQAGTLGMFDVPYEKVDEHVFLQKSWQGNIQDTTSTENMGDLLEKVGEYQKLLERETSSREQVEDMLQQERAENRRLRKKLKKLSRSLPSSESLLADENVLNTIETTFEEFAKFLSIVRNNGQGHLIEESGLGALEGFKNKRQSQKSAASSDTGPTLTDDSF